MTLRTVLRVVAWLLLAGLIFATLSPNDMRPASPLPTQGERGIALAVVGFVFALAYPGRVLLVATIVLGATIGLELLQLVTPSRHGRLIDVSAKLVGGAIGIAIGWIVNRILRLR